MEISPDRERSVHLQVGRLNRVGVVFSCPGRHEEAAGYPAARATGRNLELLLALLGEALGRDDLTRENITITNAWPEVEYRERTGRTEASVREVLAPENVERLKRELDEVVELVIFCGGRAKALAPLLRLRHRPRMVFIKHPGLRGLSTIRSDADGHPIAAAGAVACAGGGAERRARQGENTRRRVAVLVASICQQLRDPQPDDQAGA